MIKITIEYNGRDIKTIEAKGHSGYAESGSDIICSAVSVLVQNLQKGLNEILKIQTKFLLDEKTPRLRIELPALDEKSNREAQILMQSTLLGLKDIASSYPKFIDIKEY